MSQLRASRIRELFDRGRQIPDCLDLSIGQSDFEVPEPIRTAAEAAVQKGFGRYSPTEGDPELVAATRGYLERRVGLPADESVMMTSGATGALTLAMMALAGPGDEVLIPDPHFVSYRTLARIAGATPVTYDLYPSFRPDVARIERAMTERTRVLVLNSPANPTGVTFTAAEIAEIVALCRRRAVTIVSDELYEVFVYDGPHVSVKRAAGPDALLVGGLSKSYGMAGWRLGWAAGSAVLIERMRILQQFMYTCPPTPLQRAAIAAFDVNMSHHVVRYRAKRDLLFAGLRVRGYKVHQPQGAFFMFAEAPGGDDVAFCERALARGLLVVPGRAFSCRTTHFRLCFSVPDEVLFRALDVLADLIES